MRQTELNCCCHGNGEIKMAAEIEPRPVVGTKRLEGSLVAPQAPVSVPNHLTAIKTFKSGGSSGVLQTSPTVLHFSGYTVGHLHKQTLRVINASKDNQHMHIIPPSTPYFSIHYTKKRSRLVPGLSLDIAVQFRPTEWKYYYDCIRIHCKDDQNLLVPIHAYPVMSTANFPSHVRFPATPVGRTRNKTLSLECDVPIDFEFQLAAVQHHPAFIVTPMRGVVPANGKVDVMVTFAPTEFNTAIMKLKLELTQFNSAPLVCTFSGSSVPGLDIESVGSRSQQPSLPAKLTKTVTLPPLNSKDQSTKIKRRGVSAAKKKGELSTGVGASKTENSIKLNTPASVSKILTQKSSRQLCTGSMAKTGRPLTETKFLQKVRKIANEERANRLRWVPQLGSSEPSASQMETVLQDRSVANKLYLQHYCYKPEAGSELLHTHTQCLHRRTRRLAHEHSNVAPKFDRYSNNLWWKRQRARLAFIRAARRVLIQVRAQKRLEKLRRLIENMKNGREDEELRVSEVSKPLSLPPPNILPLSFPKSVNVSTLDTDNTKNPTFQVKQTEVKVQKQVPLMELKVPVQYQLLGYTTPTLPELGTYIWPGLPRPLKTGAEAELEHLGHTPGVNPTFLTPSSPPSLTPSHPHTTPPLTTHQSLTVQDVECEQKGATEVKGVEGGGTEATILPLIPPSNIQDRHPQNLFNPCPGVLHLLPPLPHSEVTIDHTLMPLPLHPDSSTHTHPPLHPQDIIPGVMKWKPFPSLWLVANESLRKRGHLPQSHTHRMRDSYFDGLVPVMSEPQLLSGPQPDDLIEDHTSSEILPTPTLEMVRSQFHVPSEEPSRNTECQSDVAGTAASGLGLRIQQRLENAMALFNSTDDKKSSSR